MTKADQPPSPGVPWWVTAASVLIIPVILTLITQFYTYQAQRDEALQKIQTATAEATAHIEQLKTEAGQKSRELDIHMVEVALSLVKPDPNIDPTKIGAREWAIDVMEKFSGVRFSAAARKSIIETSVPVDKGILKGTPVTTQPAALPVVEPFGRDLFVILDGPEHATKWTDKDGATVDFAAIGADTLIKSVTPNLRLWGGHIRLATTAAASTDEGFLNYLRAYGVRIEPGTCFNLLGQFAMNGFVFGKVTDASCP